jgi:ribosomal protein S18 acetylase RimI-like enzyme
MSGKGLVGGCGWRAMVSEAAQRCYELLMRLRVRKAEEADVEAICRICAEGWRDTYHGMRRSEEIERIIAQFYMPERVRSELQAAGMDWGGWFVAQLDDGEVIAAAAGGLTDPGVGEVFVLYVDRSRRRKGAGRALLDAITEQQLVLGAREQWVSVEKGNVKAIPFYETQGFELVGERPAFEMTGTSLRYRRAQPRGARETNARQLGEADAGRVS